MLPQLAFTWQLSEIHGWGLVGVHTALYLVEQDRPPLLLEKPLMSSLRPENRARLQPLVASYEQTLALTEQNPGKTLKLRECDVMHALGNGFVPGPPSQHFQGRRNIGVIAYEDTRFDGAILERARRYDRIVVHSTYNRKLLEDQGFTNIGCALQGIDASELVVPPPSGRFGDRFVIFSGGKLEFRKGQDIVLAAFLRFHARHPDALLVTAWQNAWTEVGMGMAESTLVPHPPRVRDNRIDVRSWAFENGADESNFLDLGFLGRHQIAGVLAECHAAVFPNRCEGATNLVAMEAMACGVPVILSANTGHMDLVVGDVCLTLDDQRPVPDRNGSRVGWGESSVEELVERLETLYADRSAAKARGARAERFIRGERTWRAFAEAFVAVSGDPAAAAVSDSAPADRREGPAAPSPAMGGGAPQTMTIQDALALAHGHRDAGRLAEAETVYRQILAVRADLVPVRLGIAQTLLLQNRATAALAAYRSAIALQPDAAELHAGAGNAHQRTAGYRDAATAFRRAVTLRPDWLEGWKALGNLSALGGDAETAIEGLRRSTGQGPHQPVRLSDLHCALSSHDAMAGRRGPCAGPLNVIYRISDGGYPKPKIADKRTCLRNFLQTVGPLPGRMTVVADNCHDETVVMIEREAAEHFGRKDAIRIQRTSLGNGPSWIHARDLALEHDDAEPFYFIEDDYLHLPGAGATLLEGLERADYVSLYDHADKYKAPALAGNPVVSHGGEVTRLILTASSHWKFTTSTTMTFAVRVGTLRQDKPLFDRFTSSRHPDDFAVFINLITRGRTVLTTVPGRSTHGEPALLSPLVDWAAVAAAAAAAVADVGETVR
ncbi:glycosyltransferase [Azospirillum doebereinerae]|uniref:Glycosyltransferase n=1 Tax=Azospirillum doebereinerae TaxID=92933 RepID=A0A433J6J8_9PROT|nr:glycosyltransferase family 4 protein [Azospirillum doebereinerae]RUQ68808.1 glycosyltransferase [Azospirillum doebereinerae]